MSEYLLPAATKMGAVSLTVSDLDASLRFYEITLGFKSGNREGNTVTLTADGVTPLLRLTELPGARPKPARSTGLYHFAILVPSRHDLARSLRHLVQGGYPLQGASDHLVSEALYLADPDGNGIEIYRDRPRDQWKWRGDQMEIGTLPLDLNGLLGELAHDTSPWAGLSAGTQIGHVHLHVGDLLKARAFYNQLLGFDVMMSLSSALFVSAGGYHHHLGLNTWAGVDAPPPPADSVGLRYLTVVLPTSADLETLVSRLSDAGILVEQESGGGFVTRDPFQNTLLLTVPL